jgi:hypothetical protein
LIFGADIDDMEPGETVGRRCVRPLFIHADFGGRVPGRTQAIELELNSAFRRRRWLISSMPSTTDCRRGRSAARYHIVTSTGVSAFAQAAMFDHLLASAMREKPRDKRLSDDMIAPHARSTKLSLTCSQYLAAHHVRASSSSVVSGPRAALVV